MNKDLYKILGLDKNASENDIKKAFKKLSLKYHPDRQGGKSDKEKAAAEEKFKEIAGAYAILSDPAKKQQYDTFGTVDENVFNGNFNFGSFGSMFEDIGDIFGNMFGGRKRSSYNQQAGTSIKIRVPVTIDEIINGKINRNFEYTIEARCPDCNGAGGTGKKQCFHCNGTGMITETQRTPFGYIQNSHPCQYCNGTGIVFEKTCNKCQGTGFIKKSETVNINVTNFINGQNIVFNGKGYESKNASYPNGDLILELVFSYDSSKYIIQGNNIYEKIEVPYYDCILGNVINHKLANNEIIKVNIPKYSKEGTQITLSKHFNNMNYICIISVKMPTYIRGSEKKLLEQIKKENS